MPNFHPDTGGRRWSLIQVASSVVLRGGACAPFPSRLLRLPAVLYGAVPCAARGSSPRVFHKSPEQNAASAFCAFPVRAPQEARGLMGALSLGAAHLPPSAAPTPGPATPRAGRVPAPCVSQRPSWRMSTIQNLRRSLTTDWRPVCSAVGAAVLGAEPAPFPSPLPPVSGWAGPVHSLRALLWTC